MFTHAKVGWMLRAIVSTMAIALEIWWLLRCSEVLSEH